MSLTSNTLIVLVFVTVNISFCNVDPGVITNQRMNSPDFVEAVVFLLFLQIFTNCTVLDVSVFRSNCLKHFCEIYE